MLIGRFKRVLLYLIFLFLPLFSQGQAGKRYNYHFDQNINDKNVITTSNGIIINYNLPDISLNGITITEGEFYRISAPGHISSGEIGKPEMPVFSRLITIPENSLISYTIKDVTSKKIRPSKEKLKGLVYPRQPETSKIQDKPKPDFTIDKSHYAKRKVIRDDTVRIEYLGKIRDQQLAAIYISPAGYNPARNEFTVITSMRIEIIFRPGDSKSTTSGYTKSPLFTGMVNKGTLNYDPEDFINGYSDKPVKMIILSDTSFRKQIEPLIRWKTLKGFSVTTLYRGTGLAGSTFAEIKDTLASIYNSATEDDPPPDYLLIIGDTYRIPRSEGTTQISDLYYGEYDGNGDFLPDIYIGRLPVSDTSQVKTLVNKIIQYERFQFADTNKFYNRALVTAGNDGGNAIFMNGQVKYADSYYLNSSNKIEGHPFYYPQSASSDSLIKALFRNGLAFINYSGHGLVSGWEDPTVRTGDIKAFNNKNMYPFVISNACWTGRYSDTTAFGNKMVVSNDKGAIGFIGCSNESFWSEDFYWSVGVGAITSDPKYSETRLGAYDRLFHTNGESPSEWHITMGQVNFAGNLAVSASNSSRKKYYWETYNLLGDPSLVPFIGTPDTFNIALPDTLPNELKTLSLTLDPFSYIAVSHRDTLWDASFASPSGSAVLEMPGISDDSCLIVITRQNKVPLIKTIYFAEINKEYVNLSGTAINDSEGNNNGFADFGETFFLQTTISNLGQKDAHDLSVVISSSSDMITILSDSVNIGILPGKSDIVLTDKFSVKVSGPINDKGIVSFNLKLRDSEEEKDYIIDVKIYAPDPVLLNYVVNDSVSGNGDLFADPGETVDILFSIVNTGSRDISGSLNIDNNPEGVTINEPVVNTGIIQAGDTLQVPVSVTLSPLLLKGSEFDLVITLACDPYFDNKVFSVSVGKIRENFEYQSFNIFPWQNSFQYPWTIYNKNAFEGAFSARSGVIPHNSESVIKISVNVPYPDTIKFMYRVSSESGWDFLIVRLNSKEALKVSGEVGWKEKMIVLKEGFNLLEWIYKKDESVSNGDDCALIDLISFPASSFNRIDLKTGKILTPESGKDLTQESISAQIINFGTDTIYSFNLAYSVNDGSPVTQHFVSKAAPADTVSVEFSTMADFGGNGPYLLKVFSFNNNDGFLRNDTSSLMIYNTAIFTPVDNTENQLKVMPNPFSESFRVDLDCRNNEQLLVSIFEPAGKLMWETNLEAVPGNNIFTISPSSLKPGYYILRIRGEFLYKVAGIIKN